MNWNTEITKLFNIQFPLIQGGLAHLAYAELASAVSNAGGLGQITAMSLSNKELLRKEIKKVRELTSSPFGVNYAIGSTRKPYQDMVQVAIEEKVPIVSVTGGNPKGVLDLLKGYPIKTMVLVSTLRQAEKAEELGADAVIVVGQEGGGHIGRNDTGTIVLAPHVADKISIPVIASGGIVDGRGLMTALALGAQGVEMGTRFIATKECIHAHPSYKQALIEASGDSTTVIKRSIGAPARALINNWTEEILSIEEENNSYESIKDYISGKANKRYVHEGKKEEGFGWAGQGAAQIYNIPTVQKLMNQVKKEAELVRYKWAAIKD